MTISNTARASMGMRRKVHAKTDGRCFYCGAHVRCADEAPPRDWLLLRGGGVTMVMDHADPKARGGADHVSNRLPACGGCNSAKGWLNVDEYRTLEGMKAGDLSLSFAGDVDRPPRDWLCVFSEKYLKGLFLHNHPKAAEAISRGRPIKLRLRDAARRAAAAV
ncbi:HNH endonuclease [Tardiphaga sp. vice304]|uniref:HNH endonuclease n=1 Tax=Tardiphaga sp. vice304 TaxID=2592817 RepID=UPI001164918F|nr:HNH endonuclease signature motif containing protein [Tardiphaga sp. vice304]QDM26983.1 HNH endonuclease [Tardiphaga sp. vice304]